MKVVGTSPPNTSIFFPRRTGLPDVSELERRGSPHGSATVLINRNHSAASKSIHGIDGNSTFSHRRHFSSSCSTDGPPQHPFQTLTRTKNDTLRTSSFRRLIEHKLNRLSGSIQHILALKVLASPQRSLFMARAALSASSAACCCGFWARCCSMTVRCPTAA